MTREEKRTADNLNIVSAADLAENSAGRNLTEQELAFCQYFVAIGKKTVAGQLAGLDPRGYNRVLMKKDVKNFIAELQKEKLLNKGLTREGLIDKLIDIVNFDITDIAEIQSKDVLDDKGNVKYTKQEIKYHDLNQIQDKVAVNPITGEQLVDSKGHLIKIKDKSKTGAIKAITPGDCGRPVVQTYDKMEAIKTLAKMTGMMEEKVSVSIMDETERAQRQKSLFDKLNKLAGDSEDKGLSVEEAETNLKL